MIEIRLRFTRANTQPALACYAADPDGVLRARGLLVLALEGDRIKDISVFLDARLFAFFDLPPVLTEEDASGVPLIGWEMRKNTMMEWAP